MLKTGKLDTLVTVQQRAPNADPLSAPNAWATVGTAWADVRHQTGLQRLTADQLHSPGRCSVRVRQTACTRAIVAGMRLVIDGKNYTVVDTAPQGREAIDIVCEAKA